MRKRTLVAIPVFNEARYVEDVLGRVRRHADHILVIDDGSTDATKDLLSRQHGIKVIHHPENRGYGKSIADAFDYALGHGFEWLITMDCDEQHEPRQIPRFLREASRDDADILSGTRYPEGHDPGQAVHAPEDRRRINRIITHMLTRELRLGITDAFCGFKAYRVAALSRIRLTVPGYAMPMQFWVQAARLGLRIREVPVTLIYHDPTRHFGGLLDDAEVRLEYYRRVYRSAMRESDSLQQVASEPAGDACCR